ncbi:MAG: LPS assembly lipoprotein LptE [Sphingomonadales bacterium]|jgi:hypothetical protein
MNWSKWVAVSLLFAGCGFFKAYDPRGTFIPEDVQTFSVDFFNNEAAIVNPQLSLQFTEKLKTKFQSETRLRLINGDGDYKLGGVIKDYRIEPATRNANTGTAENQLTITVRLDFVCEKHPEKNQSKEFSFFRTYDASKNLSAVEGTLSSEISDNIVQQIFAAIALDW